MFCVIRKGIKVSKLFERYYYEGNLENLIEALDEYYDYPNTYSLAVDVFGRHYIYDPEDIDHVRPDFLDKPVKYYTKSTSVPIITVCLELSGCVGYC